MQVEIAVNFWSIFVFFLFDTVVTHSRLRVLRIELYVANL